MTPAVDPIVRDGARRCSHKEGKDLDYNVTRP